MFKESKASKFPFLVFNHMFDDELVDIVIHADLTSDTSMEFSVVEMGHLVKDGFCTDESLDDEIYAKGQVKWDGCSHVWFGDEDNACGLGYAHLCGKRYFELHCEIMMFVFSIAEDHLVGFDKDIAS